MATRTTARAKANASTATVTVGTVDDLKARIAEIETGIISARSAEENASAARKEVAGSRPERLVKLGEEYRNLSNAETDADREQSFAKIAGDALASVSYATDGARRTAVSKAALFLAVGHHGYDVLKKEVDALTASVKDTAIAKSIQPWEQVARRIKEDGKVTRKSNDPAVVRQHYLSEKLVKKVADPWAADFTRAVDGFVKAMAGLGYDADDVKASLSNLSTSDAKERARTAKATGTTTAEPEVKTSEPEETDLAALMQQIAQTQQAVMALMSAKKKK